MQLSFDFFLYSFLLGIGLAMDAFSVSLVSGLSEPAMRKKRMAFVSFIFSFFQTAMPFIGWICVSTVAKYFTFFDKCIPWIALVLLSYIGGKMLYEGIKNKDCNDEKPAIGFAALIIQGIATSIDALTAGINLAKDYSLMQYIYVFLSVAIIALITLAICICGVKLGQTVGTKLSNKAGILGGCVLIFLGLKILITDIIFKA